MRFLAFAVVFGALSAGCGGSDSGGEGGSGGSGQVCGGPGGARLLAKGEVPHAIAINDTHVFWTDVKWIGGNGESVVRMVPKAGGEVSELALEAGVRFYAIGANAETVYFSSEVMNDPASGRILSASLTTHGPPQAFASGQYAPRAIELSKSGIVWVNISGADRVGHVFHQPFVNGTAVELASDPLDSWTALALSSENAFWTSTAGTPRLSRTGLAGGGGSAVVTEGADGGPIECVATDGRDVYFSRRGTSTNTFEPQYNHDGSVYKIAATGGAATLLASNQESPSRVAAPPVAAIL